MAAAVNSSDMVAESALDQHCSVAATAAAAADVAADVAAGAVAVAVAVADAAGAAAARFRSHTGWSLGLAEGTCSFRCRAWRRSG